MIGQKPPFHTSVLLGLYGLAFGLGTNFTGNWYYPIHGISWVDLFLVMQFAFLLGTANAKYKIRIARPSTLHIAFLISLLAAWLLLATLVNAFRYTVEARDTLAILRLLYFILLIMLVSRYVEAHGYLQLIAGFCAGVVIIFYQDISGAAEVRTVVGIELLTNPNVIGAQLGLGILLCSLAVIAGHPGIFIPLAFGLAALSITTFSKGTWLLVAVGLMANFIALNLQPRTDRKKRRPVWLYLCAFLVVTGAVLTMFWGTLATLVQVKLESTQDIGSLAVRQGLLAAGLLAGLENPFGLGFGNYYHVRWMYPELLLPPLGRDDNAHNIFGQLSAVGGIPALLVLLCILALSFRTLYRLLRDKVEGSDLLKLCYVCLSVVVVVLYGSVQLELIAQPSFWLYCAVLIGWLHSRPRKPKPADVRHDR